MNKMLPSEIRMNIAEFIPTDVYEEIRENRIFPGTVSSVLDLDTGVLIEKMDHLGLDPMVEIRREEERQQMKYGAKDPSTTFFLELFVDGPVMHVVSINPWEPFMAKVREKISSANKYCFLITNGILLYVLEPNLPWIRTDAIDTILSTMLNIQGMKYRWDNLYRKIISSFNDHIFLYTATSGGFLYGPKRDMRGLLLAYLNAREGEPVQLTLNQQNDLKSITNIEEQFGGILGAKIFRYQPPPPTPLTTVCAPIVNPETMCMAFTKRNNLPCKNKAKVMKNGHWYCGIHAKSNY